MREYEEKKKKKKVGPSFPPLPLVEQVKTAMEGHGPFQNKNHFTFTQISIGKPCALPWQLKTLYKNITKTDN